MININSITYKTIKGSRTKKNNKNKSLKAKSFSPLINKKLLIHSLKTLEVQSIKLCDSLLKVNIKIKDKYVCKNYNDNEVKKILLHNLRASKHLDVSRFIPPIQLLSNCWFNTMYVAFFFSDKGRKFFRFFRELMIVGKKLDNSPLPKTIAKLFFILNLFIEASYNQTSKSHTFYNKINSLSNKLNTNFFIFHIYKIIKKDPSSINPNILLSNSNKIYDIPNINDAGNPLNYYEEILNYLNYNILKLMKHKLVSKKIIANVIQESFNSLSSATIPDIIIIEDFESGTLFETNYNLLDTNNKSYNYILDSIILTNKDHFDPKANSHFVSVLTINKKSYKYDGSSTSKLEPFNWTKLINSNKDWSFKEKSIYEEELYNFTKGYKIMFYYRS
uniref:USP domain-containing protein n=1 Tax=viral metagenome TaxID=1070528 RepID=A0A6C0DZZ3_9ZZZZ